MNLRLLHLLVLASALAGAQLATAVDVVIPPTVVLSGGTNSDNYTLINNGQVQGSGVFNGTFNAAAHNLTVDSLTGDMFFNGAISGSASSPLQNLTIAAGAHTVHLNASNSFTGDLLLAPGSLKIGDGHALGSGAGTFRTLGGAVFVDLNGKLVSAQTASIGANTTFMNSFASPASWGGVIGISSATLTFNASSGDIVAGGNISSGGFGGVVKTGVNVLTASGDNSGLTGAWNLQQGTLRFGHSNAVGTAVLVNGTGTTVDVNGQTMTAKPIQIDTTSVTILNSAAASAAWNGVIEATLSNSVVTFDAAAGNLLVNGPILQGSSPAAVSIQGTKLTTFTSASNSYTGNTSLAGGNLALAAGSLLEFVIGAHGANNAVTGTGNVFLDGQFSFSLTGASTNLGDSWQIVDTGTLAATWGTNFTVLGFSDLGLGLWEKNQSGTTYRFSESTGQLSVVPEPSTVLLAATAGTPLLVLRRRRRTP